MNRLCDFVSQPVKSNGSTFHRRSSLALVTSQHLSVVRDATLDYFSLARACLTACCAGPVLPFAPNRDADTDRPAGCSAWAAPMAASHGSVITHERAAEIAVQPSLPTAYSFCNCSCNQYKGAGSWGKTCPGRWSRSSLLCKLGTYVDRFYFLQGNRTQTQGNNVVPATGITQNVSNRAPQSLQKPRIVILGSGWGAMSFIKGMSKKDRYTPWLTSSSLTRELRLAYQSSLLGPVTSCVKSVLVSQPA